MKHKVSQDIRDLNPDLPAEFFDGGTKTGETKAAEPSHLEQKFHDLWQELGGPELVTEEMLNEGRRFRTDFSHAASKVAIEIEGGVWTAGRHLRPLGFISDAQKYNQLEMDGWSVLRLVPDMISEPYLQAVIAHVLRRAP